MHMQVMTAHKCDRTEASLVPKPFPPPVIDRLQMQIWQGKAWEMWSCARRQVDREGERCPTVILSVLLASIRPQRCEQ